jgi:multiple antibiotic resistance protein
VDQGVSAIVLVAVLGITYLMMKLSDRILKIIGKNGAAIMVKVMGMLLAALSVELIMEAIGTERWLSPQ